MWGRGGMNSCLPNKPSGTGQSSDCTSEELLIWELLSVYYWAASAKLSVRSVSLCPDCEPVTTGLAPDGVVNIDWESFTLRFQTLMAFQASSLFDGEVLAWSGKHRNTLFCLSLTTLIWSTEPLQILTFIWDADWILHMESRTWLTLLCLYTCS